MDNREERLRQKAYDIWQAEGEPHGRDRDHWEMAERDIEPEASKEAQTTHEIAPEAKPKPRRGKTVATSSETSADISTPAPASKPKARKPRATKPN